MKSLSNSKFFNPWIFTGLSVIASALIYLVIALVTGIESFRTGMIISLVTPAVIAYPISYYIISSYRVIRQQKLELERLNAINNKLFSIIAHDIISPIASVRNIIDLITDRDIDRSEGLELLGNLSGKIDQLLLFLNDLLDWSKRQIEDIPLVPDEVNIRTIVDYTVELYRDFIDSKDIVLNLGDLDKTVFADKESFSFIIRNLLNNAIKFTPNKGTISIGAQENEGTIHTIIEDTGVGISAVNLEKIINSKEWFTTPGTQSEKGTGFGIKTCFKYAYMQNGNMLIESEPKKGTRITIIFPKFKSESASETNKD